MNTQYADHKLTDDLERKLIEREIGEGAGRDTTGVNTFLLEIVVGTLLLLGMLLLAARVG
ncbi:MAG: hypothetical protein IPO58_25000 [Betaproteobacteria bacterium]|nr:hypothetical protein [Betaproteobacteria bacterium]MBK9609490.1 hypothetical protein [Betaproteobacteria bacterium]